MDQQNKNEILAQEEQEIIPAEEASLVPDEISEEKKPAFIDIDGDDDEKEEAAPEVVPTAFQKKIAAIPEDKWKKYQILGGFLLGALTVFTLFYRQDENSGAMSYSFLIAICLALFAPNYIEKQGKRDILFGRKVMCITMAVGMVIAVLILGFATNWQVFKPQA